MSASNTSRSWSPSRSISASSSSCSASACPTLFTIASSAARWRVSSNSRAFSSATLRLAGERRQEPDVGLAERVLAVEVLQRDHAGRRPPTTSGTNTADFGLARDHDRLPDLASARRVLVDQQRLARLEDVLAEADVADRLVREPHAALDRSTGSRISARRRVEDPDVDDLRVEDLLHPVSDEVVHRLRLELRGEAALHVVDQRELGVALPRLVEQPRVLERDAQARRRASSGAGRRRR